MQLEVKIMPTKLLLALVIALWLYAAILLMRMMGLELGSVGRPWVWFRLVMLRLRRRLEVAHPPTPPWSERFASNYVCNAADFDTPLKNDDYYIIRSWYPTGI